MSYSPTTQKRKRARERFKLYYDRLRQKPREQPSLVVLEANYDIEIKIQNSEDERCGTTITVPAYTIGDLGRILDKSTPALKLWTKSGILPQPTYKANHKIRTWLYTYDQVVAIFERVPLLCEVSRNGRENLQFSRELREVWRLMPDGVWPNGKVLAVDPLPVKPEQAVRYIYALLDPQDMSVRYVGKATNVNKRKEEHVTQALYKAAGGSPLSAKESWLCRLREQGLEPLIEMLEQTTETDAAKCESSWMEKYAREGARLLNILTPEQEELGFEPPPGTTKPSP